MTEAAQEKWRNVRPLRRSEAEGLNVSRGALGQFLADQFEEAFGLKVDEVMFETFPDGLYATLYVEGAGATAHNVWAVAVASALSDAGVDVNVVVRATSDRLEA